MKRNNLFWFGELILIVGLVFWIMATFFASGLDIFMIMSPEDITSINEHPFFRLGWGIVGAVLTGWGITLIALGQPLNDSIVSQKKLLYFAVETWYILDSITSLITKFYYNIISNTIFLIVGVVLIRSYYQSDDNNQ